MPEFLRLMVIAGDWGGKWDTVLAKVASWGCNAASIYNYPKHAQSWYEELYAAANKHSIKLSPWMKWEMAAGAWQPGHIEWAAKQPALWGWYAFEEPNISEACGSEAYVRDKYQMIKARDPEHVVWGVYAMGDRLCNWVPEAFDMVGGDLYVANKEGQMKVKGWYDIVKNLGKPFLAMIKAWDTREAAMREAIRYWQNLAPNFVAIGYFRYITVRGTALEGAVTNINRDYGFVPETFTEKTITCPVCGSTLKLTISSIESKNIAQICPVCGEAVGTGYTLSIITELPWPVYTTQAKTCPQCSSELELTISSVIGENVTQVCPVCGENIGTGYSVVVTKEEPWPPPTYTKETKFCPQCTSELELTVSSAPEENVSQTCPVCGASIDEGTEVAVITEQPWPPIGEVVPWWKRYAPHLVVGGLVAVTITYFSLKKRG